jgi:SAM-dependent methyltransferase
MYETLMALAKQPELNSPETARLYRALWEDEHISKGMLESHLDPDNDGATNSHAFVAKSVKWIAETAPPSQYGKLLDLGCGPGVYAERFAAAGYAVTGVDYSRRSVDYAMKQTAVSGSGIKYLYQDYLTLDYEARFDLVTLINKDYAVLPASDRATLLARVYRALKPGGKFIFDVKTPISRKPEKRIWYYSENGDFFYEKQHLRLEAVYQYDDSDKTELEQYIMITDESVKCFLVPNHYFTRDELLAEVQKVGFQACGIYDDIAGKKYSGEGGEICGIFMKPSCGESLPAGQK